MDRLVKIFAPRSKLDFVVKAACLLLVLGGLNWLRDMIEHGDGADGFMNNFLESAFVGFFPTLLALALVGHLNNLQASLAKAAITDPLTGLPNRRSFFDQVNGTLNNKSGVLLMLDADHFKAVNDTYGHGAGDQCLIQIAALLRAHLRADDIVARLGGEEFGVVLVGARREEAHSIGKRLVAGVRLKIEGRHAPHTVTLSIGAVCTVGHNDAAELLSIADTALYDAKAAGRARMVFADPHTPSNGTTAIGPRDAA